MSGGYDFFISYAHEDVVQVRELDRSLRELLRKPLRRGRFQVFRDERRLGAGHDLGERLEASLASAKHLVVVLTPASCGSKWVNEEIDYWCNRLGRTSDLLIVRADPTLDLTWNAGASRFVAAEQLPPALVAATTVEPLHVDLGEGEAAAANAAVLLASAVLGKAPEEIAGEDFRLQRRRQRLTRATAAVLAVLALAAGVATVFAFHSAGVAKERERAATAEAVSSQAAAEESSRPDKALALAVAGRRLDPDGGGNEVLARLVEASDPRDHLIRGPSEMLGPIAVSPDGQRIALGNADGGVWLLSVAEDEPSDSPELQLSSGVVGAAFADDTHILVALSEGRVVELEIDGESLDEGVDVEVPEPTAWAFNERSGYAAVSGIDAVTLIHWQPGYLKVVGTTSSSPLLGALAFDKAGSKLLVGARDATALLTVPELRPQPVPGDFGMVTNARAAAISSDSTLLLGGDPIATADRRGVVEFVDPTSAGSVGLATVELPIDVLTACGDSTYYGDAAGNFGLMGSENFLTAGAADKNPNPLPLAQIGPNIAGIGCAERGPVAVSAGGGLILVRSDPDGLDASAGSVRPYSEASDELGSGVTAGLSIVDGGTAFKTADGTVIPFEGDDAERAAQILNGRNGGPSSCLSLGQDEIIDFDLEADSGERAIGSCGSLELSVTGGVGEDLIVTRDGEALVTIPAEERLGTYSVAVSDDGRLLFVGGYTDGRVYDLSKDSARQFLTIHTTDVFSSAAFAMDDDVLLTSETNPQGGYNILGIHPIDGAPLDEAACSMGNLSLASTVASDLISSDELGDLSC
ncbi:MAG: toll/interleukin-1 receptor domain-containing protein [Solirubrobacterales bacterium]